MIKIPCSSGYHLVDSDENILTWQWSVDASLENYMDVLHYKIDQLIYSGKVDGCTLVEVKEWQELGMTHYRRRYAKPGHVTYFPSEPVTDARDGA